MMARVILVTFPGYPYTYSSLMPDNGMAALAGCLADAGHAVRVLDFGTVDTMRRLFPSAAGRLLRPVARRIFEEGKPPRTRDLVRVTLADLMIERHKRAVFRAVADEVAAASRAFGANLVGLKLWNGDGFAGSIEIARRVKEVSPATCVFGGGPQVDWFGRHILDHTDAFDGLARGDGEVVVAALAEYADGRRELTDVPNLLHRGGTTDEARVESLDDLPMPCYEEDVYPAPHSGGQIRFVVLDESRGCPGQCAFCIHPQKSGGGWLVKSPQRVVHEMARARAVFGARRVVYAGSNTPSRAANANAAAVLDAGLGVEYACFGHVKGMKHADFALLRRSGCRSIFFGVESGDPRLLRDTFHKGTRPEEIRTVLGRAKAAEISTLASIIFPAPGEDADSERRTRDLLRTVRPDAVPVQFPGVIPGSEWWHHPGKFGFEMTMPERKLWAYVLTYKIKLLFPPRFWRPLPYRIDGQSYKQFSSRTEQFVRDLERDGTVTGMGHDLVLMAHATDLSLREFRDRTRRDFFTGDADAAQEMVDRINARPVAAPRPVAPPAAVEVRS
jgi:hypothetical protein